MSELVGGFDSVFVALADPTRRQVLDALAEAGPASASALAARLPVSRQAVVKHLAVLASAGLIAGGRAGREVRYQVRPAALDASARWLAERAAMWERRLQALRREAEATEDTAAETARSTTRYPVRPHAGH
ncbi:MAG TPA: metalloregulator ArsR/SmtB family transcription factor [Dehalococcoidia bacterium]|nr:metalloregulator ArsR/SmtB family transcription factor [Dehalococcoidia bacterium]